MPRFPFTLIVTGPVADRLDELRAAGADALVGENGTHNARFDREAPSLAEALESAAAAVDSIDGLSVVRLRSGEVMTEELADEIADEAEAGYELDELSDIRAGPSGR